MARHVRKGDMVIVLTGSDAKDKRPRKVLRVIPDKNQVLVEGVNVRRKHMKPSQTNQQGGIIEREMPIHASNVVPAVNGKPTRVRFETRKDGSKVRLAVTDGSVIGQELRKARK